MKIPGCTVPPSSCLWSSLIVLSIVAVVEGAGSVSYQSKTVVTETESGGTIRTYVDIPEATEPCTPEECEWWKRIRKAGADINKKSDDKSKAKFSLLLEEGKQKAFRIPLKDRAPLFLGSLLYPDIARKMKITGTMVLSIEVGADGLVWDVQLIRGLESEIDKKVIQATRQHIFLPAVKNGVFVAERSNVERYFYYNPMSR